MKIVISSGHGKYVRGASGYLDEVDEAVRVVDEVAQILGDSGVGVKVFHDTTSKTQSENLNAIVNYHNAQERDLDVSVHFNCNVTTQNPVGTECLYKTQQELAAKVAEAIGYSSTLIDRGEKYRSDLKFLNATEEPAILIEVCFVDSRADADAYDMHFADICKAIAKTISGKSPNPNPTPPPNPGAKVEIKTTGEVEVWVNGSRI